MRGASEDRCVQVSEGWRPRGCLGDVSATAQRITAPMRWRTRRAVSGLACQIGIGTVMLITFVEVVSGISVRVFWMYHTLSSRVH